MATSPVNNKGIGSIPASRTENAGAAANASESSKTAKGTAAKAGSAQVQISAEAKERADAHAKALDIARGTPDVREDRIADIKARIQAGTYEIDSGKIADGMLREAIKERLAIMD